MKLERFKTVYILWTLTKILIGNHFSIFWILNSIQISTYKKTLKSKEKWQKRFICKTTLSGIKIFWSVLRIWSFFCGLSLFFIFVYIMFPLGVLYPEHWQLAFDYVVIACSLDSIRPGLPHWTRSICLKSATPGLTLVELPRHYY